MLEQKIQHKIRACFYAELIIIGLLSNITKSCNFLFLIDHYEH